ncbi:MAG: class I SAM-dependent methyltransferase [Chloroflexota bacterium]
MTTIAAHAIDQDLETWPLSPYISEAQLEEWRRNEANKQLNRASATKKQAFLKRKATVKGYHHYHRYLKKLNLEPAGKLLEIGAGNFWLSSYLSTFTTVQQLVGVELSEQRIRAFREHTLSLFQNAQAEKITYAVGDMHTIQRPDAYFDYIVGDAVLHHADSLVTVLRESWRCLKPGGWFIAFREPLLPKLRRKPPVFNAQTPENGSAQYYYIDGWRSAFINGRFQNIRTCPFYEHHQLKKVPIPWRLQPFVRLGFTITHRHYYPKICIAAQKPFR